ncbi:hypothetical protein LguiB_016431 [Lonicera macranthoides]
MIGVLDLVGEGAKVLYVRKTDEYHSRTQVNDFIIGGGTTAIIDFSLATSFGASTRVLVRVLEVSMALRFTILGSSVAM